MRIEVLTPSQREERDRMIAAKRGVIHMLRQNEAYARLRRLELQRDLAEMEAEDHGRSVYR